MFVFEGICNHRVHQLVVNTVFLQASAKQYQHCFVLPWRFPFAELKTTGCQEPFKHEHLGRQSNKSAGKTRTFKGTTCMRMAKLVRWLHKHTEYVMFPSERTQPSLDQMPSFELKRHVRLLYTYKWERGGAINWKETWNDQTCNGVSEYLKWELTCSPGSHSRGRPYCSD